jgi:hypothetical protein
MTTTAPELPIGTQVVLRERIGDAQRGATGRVSGAPAEGLYPIRLADDRVVHAGRGELALRKAYQSSVLPEAAADPLALVAGHTIYAAVVGSRAYGLATDASDLDLRGVYVAPTSAFWSLNKPPAHIEGPGHDQFSWEVERFCELALKANPNLLEVLHSPIVVTMTPLGEELLELRDAFLSQLVYQTYLGYTLSQFKKIEADLRRDGVPKWKHVMHLLRLLLAVRELLREGTVVVDVGEHRDRLLRVRGGELPWTEIEAWRLELHADVDDALEHTPLPAAPDAERVDAWLRSVRARSALSDLGGSVKP